MSNTDNDNAKSKRRRADEWAACVQAIAKTSDENAFKALFAHFAPRVKSYILRTGLSAGIAEEIAQETMIIVWRKAAQFQAHKASASTWIFTIARNKKIDRFRKDAKPLPDANDPTYMWKDDVSPEAASSDNQYAQRLHDALQTLPDEQRKILTLSFLEDNPHGEIARQLGIPLGTVKSRVRLGLQRLRKQMDGLREGAL